MDSSNYKNIKTGAKYYHTNSATATSTEFARPLTTTNI